MKSRKETGQQQTNLSSQRVKSCKILKIKKDIMIVIRKSIKNNYNSSSRRKKDKLKYVN